MVQVVLMTAAFLSILVLVTFLLRYVLGLTTIVSAMLAVSATSVGLLVAVTVQYYFALTVRSTAVVLALLVFVFALAHEAVT